MPRYPLNNFEIQQYYQNEHQFNDVSSVKNLPNTVKHGTFEINLDEHANIRTHLFLLLYYYLFPFIFLT